MEENKEKSIEELNKIINALKARCMQLEQVLGSIDNTKLRLDMLFKVIEFEDSFPSKFVSQCTE